MWRFKPFSWLAVLVLGVWWIVPVLQQTDSVAAQAPVASTPEARLLLSILDELLAQRALLQRTWVNVHRAQALTEQLARQQARADSLSGEINLLQSETEQALDTTAVEDELKDMLAAIDAARDPQQRSILVEEYTSTRRSAERQRQYALAQSQLARQRQAQLELELHAEQGRLASSQSLLDALDREFANQLELNRQSR